MPITCPNCDRVLEYSKDPPIFCAYCGSRLPKPSLSATRDYQPKSSSLSDPEAGSEREIGPTPSQVGVYQIKRLLGTGGMGNVYEAENTVTGQAVAVKLLAKQFASNPVAVERFRLEGKLASQITHPRCVFVYTADAEAGQPYIVMELMPGTTLKDLVEERGPLPPQETIALMLDVIEGLLEAHRHGVIHRDVKPSNCFLVNEGRVKIGDFGLSKSLTANANLTQSGAFLGTVLYASPEQIRGQDVEYASDVYSVCATLFYLLTGRAPFQHESVTAALAKIISEDPPHVRSLRPEVPGSLARVVMRGLQREPSRRYHNLEELRDALVALVPSRLGLGGLWVRIGAYILDNLFVQGTLTLLMMILFSGNQQGYWLVPASVAAEYLYFTLLEGWAGASLGKRLLRLRVCHVGSTDPPGLKRSALRNLIFYVLIYGPFTLMGMLVGSFREPTMIPAAMVVSAIGLLLLVLPMRRRNNYRGLHEWFSGTCVLKLPRRRRALRLTPRRTRRLDSLLPPGADIPSRIGSFVVRGVGETGNDEERLLLAEDTVLGRRVLIWLKPTDQPTLEGPRMDVSRPTRPRAIGRGSVTIHGREYGWQAFVAPVGAPLPDVIDLDRPLRWPTVRPILEQLSEELVAAEADGTLPSTLDIDQVWVEPTGLVQLIDMPVRSPGLGPVANKSRESEDDPRRNIHLLAETATLAMEGRPRRGSADHDAWVRAPLPRYASQLLHPLLTDPPIITQPDQFRMALQGVRHEPDQVVMSSRLGQIGIQAGFLAVGFLFMFMLPLIYPVSNFIESRLYVETADRVLDHDELSPEDRDRIQVVRDTEQARMIRLRANMSTLQQTLLAQMVRDDSERNLALTPEQEQELILDVAEGGQREGSIISATLLIMSWPFLWALGAFGFRGGISWWLTSIQIVRKDGQAIRRRRAALRALLIWLPIASLMMACVLVQELSEDMGRIQSGLWWLGLALLPIYVAFAAMFPTRPPQDRLLGTYLVPR